MLERIGQPGYENISIPDADVVADVGAIMESGLRDPQIAEIGVGVGATTVVVAGLMKGQGTLHLFDFADKLDELREDLAQRGFSNVVFYGNTHKYWDSYVWSLMKLVAQGETKFDYAYLDGSHAYIHDVPAFFLIDRLLKKGGVINFDDYHWSYASSSTQNPGRKPRILKFLTDDQINIGNVRLIVDALVKTDPCYEEIKPNKLYRKIASRF